MDEILTAEQVANILQVHPFTVLKFIKQGKLKASKLGRVYRIRRSDVDEFLDNQVQTATQKSKPKKQKKSKDSKSPKKARNARKDQKTPRSDTKAPQESSNGAKGGPQGEVPTKEVTEQKEPPQRSERNDLDHYKLEI